MKLQEVYKNQLINNLKLFNVVLGLSTIGNPSIKEFLEASSVSYKKVCRNRENKKKAISTIMELSSDIMILSEDCSFYNLNLIDLSVYERLDFLLDKVLKFSSADSIKDFFPSDFMETIGYLQAIEMSFGENIKSSISYIVIRNFLVLCNLRLYRFAYYYAVFIRCQIFISEGLSPRIEYSDLYKSELSLAIKNDRKKFSKNLKKKISKNVKDIANKVPLVNIEEKRDPKFIGETISAPMSESNLSLDSMNEKVNNFVDNYKKEKYDVSPSERKENIKDGIKSTVSDVGKEAINVTKDVGKNVYSGAKNLAKEKLETPINVVKEKVDGVKSVINESVGATNKEFDKNLENIIKSNSHVDLEGIDNSNSFSQADSKNVNESTTPSKSSLSSLRKSKKKEKEKLKKKPSAIENLRKSRINVSSDNNVSNPINNVSNPINNVVKEKPISTPNMKEEKDVVKETANVTTSSMSRERDVVKETPVVKQSPIVKQKSVVQEKSIAKEKASDKKVRDVSGLNSSDLFSNTAKEIVNEPVVNPSMSSSVRVRPGLKGKIRKTGNESVSKEKAVKQSTNSSPSKSVNSSPSVASKTTPSKPLSKQEVSSPSKSANKPTASKSTDNQPTLEKPKETKDKSSSQPMKKFVRARIRKESSHSKRINNESINTNTNDKSELKSSEVNPNNYNSINTVSNNYIGSSSFFS